MKEYLLRLPSGEWVYHNNELDSQPKHVERVVIPEGATSFIVPKEGAGAFFYKNGWGEFFGMSCWTKSGIKEPYEILWQRPSQPEELPFVGDDQYNPFGQDGEDDDVKHSHYYKNVAHLDKVDVYRVLDLFSVTDHALGHAVKKLLCLGKRGHKDHDTDIQDAIDTLIRYQEMCEENRNEK